MIDRFDEVTFSVCCGTSIPPWYCVGSIERYCCCIAPGSDCDAITWPHNVLSCIPPWYEPCDIWLSHSLLEAGVIGPPHEVAGCGTCNCPPGSPAKGAGILHGGQGPLLVGLKVLHEGHSI